MVQEDQATITFIQLMKEDLGIFRLLPNDGFTIENGEMTPTMKTRRHAIIERYRETLNGLY